MRFLPTILAFVAALSFGSAALAGPLDRAERFRPDVYPSKIEAAAGLARRVADALNGSREFSEAGSIIVVCPQAMCDEANTAMAQVLREQFPSAKVVLGSQVSEPAGERMLIDIAPACSDGDDGSGVVTLTVNGGGVDRAFTARYLDKPWVADFTTFEHAQPQRHWIVGRSTKLASGQDEALALARRDAARELSSRVIERLRVRNRGRADRILVSEAFIVTHINSALSNRHHIEDSFAQRLESTSGEVWKAWVLAEASPENVDALASYVSEAARAQAAATKARQAEQARGWGSVAGFLGVILLLYMLINALTKGYFLWRLRAAALLLSIVGILIVLAIT